MTRIGKRGRTAGVRTLREKALNHFLFIGVDDIRRVLIEFIRYYNGYYNGARPSQAIHGIPDPYPELRQPPPRTGELVALPVLGGTEHDYRRALYGVFAEYGVAVW